MVERSLWIGACRIKYLWNKTDCFLTGDSKSHCRKTFTCICWCCYRGLWVQVNQLKSIIKMTQRTCATMISFNININNINRAILNWHHIFYFCQITARRRGPFLVNLLKQPKWPSSHRSSSEAIIESISEYPISSSRCI